MGFPVYKIILIVADVLIGLAVAWGVFCIVRAAVKDEEGWAKRKRRSKRTRIIIYSVIAAAVVEAAIVFFIVLFPVIQSALLI